jgi:hypothetical protein
MVLSMTLCSVPLIASYLFLELIVKQGCSINRMLTEKV